MPSNQGFFEPCWTVIEPGGPMPPDHDLDCECRFCGLKAANRHPLSQRFHDLLREIGELHDRKQADYGQPSDPFYNVRQSAGWGIQPWVGAMMRADDKMGRLRTLSAFGGVLRNESVEDSLLDIAVYALIALVLYEESTIVEPVPARSGQ